jgi:hypothetical protein
MAPSLPAASRPSKIGDGLPAFLDRLALQADHRQLQVAEFGFVVVGLAHGASLPPDSVQLR